MDHNKFFGRLLVPLPALISLHSLSSSLTSVLLPFFFVLPSPPLLFLSRTPSSLPFLSRPFSFSCLLFCNCRTSSGSAAAASAEERLGGERGRGGEGERGRGGEGERGRGWSYQLAHVRRSMNVRLASPAFRSFGTTVGFALCSPFILSRNSAPSSLLLGHLLEVRDEELHHCIDA